jgi:hypothetical protein
MSSTETAEPSGRFSTEPRPIELSRLRRDRTLRRGAIALLSVFLFVGLSGSLGAHTSVASAETEGYILTVTYPLVTRPGLPIRWEIQVQHPGGFSEPLRLATTFDYLHLFDISNLEPDASSATATRDQVIYVFDPPPGDTFRVSMDGNTEPDIHELPEAATGLVVGGRTVVQVTYSTRVVP